MSTHHVFTTQYASSIVSTLHCPDRVIFKGYLPFFRDGDLHNLADYGLRIRRMDFLKYLEERSDELIAHAKRSAEETGATYRFVTGPHSKEELVRAEIVQRKLTEGLVMVLCVMETCRGVKLKHGKNRPTLAFTNRPQRVVYYYYLDAEFGLMHVRIQTFFPYVVSVYVNGHDWVARQMAKKGLKFQQTDNAFTQLDDPRQAQRLADRFVRLNWVKVLDRFVRRVHPVLQQPWLRGHSYYWVIDQAEYSTDVLFRDRPALQAIFPQLVEHALLQFSADDVLKFLGRKLVPQFDGEVLTLVRHQRVPGTRVKHRMKGNWLKMYDKFGVILRIETVIHQAREFHVRKRCRRQGKRVTRWCPMTKGVSNFYRYREVSRAANERYLNALANAPVSARTTTTQDLDRLSRPVRYKKRQRRGLNLMQEEEQRLFLAVLLGNNRINGFRNRDVTDRLFAATKDPAVHRRRMHRTTRLLQLLRAHRLIRKVPRSQRYQITVLGDRYMTTAIRIRVKEFPKETPCAA